MYINANQKKIISDYINRVESNKFFAFGVNNNLVFAIKEYMLADYSSKNLKFNNLFKFLWTVTTNHVHKVFEDNNLKTLKYILGDKNALVYKRIWDRSINFTYTTGYVRRSYRTKKSTSLYFSKNLEKLTEYTYLLATNFSLVNYLTSNTKDSENISVIADLIAIELNNDNEVVFNHIKNIIYNDNNFAVLTREIIRGILMSKNVKAYKMVNDLLLASKLQEGLRQSIVESMDECSRESFVYLLKSIIDNNLIRFSSILRAFSTWTGLILDVERPKVNLRCFETAYKCITDKKYLNTCLNSIDNLEIYIGLWATAFDEVEDVKKPIESLMKSDKKYQRQSGLLFLYDTQFNIFKHGIACKSIDVIDLDVLVLVIKNLFGNLNTYDMKHNNGERLQSYNYNKVDYGKKLFYKLKNVLELMPKKEIVFNEIVFPWINLSLTVSEIIEKMMMSVYLDYDNEVVDYLIEIKDSMSPQNRVLLVEHFLKVPSQGLQRTTLINLCGDRVANVRNAAFKLLSSFEIDRDEYIEIENFLEYKSGDLRKNCINLLLKQNSNNLYLSVKRLMESDNENKRLAALDLINVIESNVSYESIRNNSRKLINKNDEVSQRELVIANDIINGVSNTKKLENGLGLFDVGIKSEYITFNDSYNIEVDSYKILNSDRTQFILSEFDKLIYENRNYEYEVINYLGNRSKVTLGGTPFLQLKEAGNHTISSYPFIDEVLEFIKENAITDEELVYLDFYIRINGFNAKSNYLDWYKVFINKHLNYSDITVYEKFISNLKYKDKIREYLTFLVMNSSSTEAFNLSYSILIKIFMKLEKDEHTKECMKNNRFYVGNSKNLAVESFVVSYWLRLMANKCKDAKQFSQYFSLAYNYYKACDYLSHATLTLIDFGGALELGLISENEVYKEMISRPLSAENIQLCTNPRQNTLNANYSKLQKIRDNVVDVLTEIETKRGELNTEVTHLASMIKRCYGVRNFTTIILNSEKDSYVRGYNFINGNSTKNQVLSYLLKCCYPNKLDNVETLKNAFGNRTVSEKQLIEAAMYAPQWLDIIADYLNDPGLKSVCWYFHSHVNSVFNEEKEIIVARYSTISSQDFKDGAFDSIWFKEAYAGISEKRFKMIYNSAKYIADGNLHKRSQLFADAVLGKLDIETVNNRIVEKRNKDYLLAFGIIPIVDKKDILNRYEYIQQYLKESKQFGAQRRASEGRSVQVALVNLARNAGYSDVNRMIWDMETAKVDSISTYLENYYIDDIELKLCIDEFGKTTIKIRKNDKELKVIPDKYKKHEYIKQLTTIRKELNDQFLRARSIFEELMEKGERFKSQELINLQSNPVLFPIISKLVFIANKGNGFLRNNTLVNFSGEIYLLENNEEVMLAHPVHLFELGCWAEYQKHVFTEKLVQPFKQIYRELYVLNNDELTEKNQSRRYAGHQVQPKKTIALLKNRGWILNFEEGLQKVFYKENLVATIYAIADWFSPSEIESPTIELVRFEDRFTSKIVDLESVPKLVFSEVMRDVDLVVSVAHVGGVDPEASLSTIEIRSVIVNELLILLKLKNVEIKGSHAFINGVHGEYTVHLGSGIAHKMGTGALNILPVLSSHRGRLFLPFIDEDPRSAEILSKIILLAEDSKLKDPSILVQITQNGN